MANNNLQKIFKVQEDYQKKLDIREKKIGALSAKLSELDIQKAKLEEELDNAIDNDDKTTFAEINRRLTDLNGERTFYVSRIEKAKKRSGINDTDEAQKMVNEIRGCCTDTFKDLCVLFIEDVEKLTNTIMPRLKDIDEAAAFASRVSDDNNLPKIFQGSDTVNLYGKCVSLQNDARNMRAFVKSHFGGM